MSEKNVKVPEGMLEAVAAAQRERWNYSEDAHSKVDCNTVLDLEAALRWLSENPIVPTDEQVEEMKTKLVPVHPHWGNIVAEWQRRMFLAPEPEDELVAYLKARNPENKTLWQAGYNTAISDIERFHSEKAGEK